MREPVELTESKCLELLTGGVVGRVAVCSSSGPAIVPVNYAVVDESIVFRTAPYTALGTSAWPRRLAFEIDHVDYERQRAWSVVAAGPGEPVESSAELDTIRASWDPRPWAGGTRLLYVRLRWDSLTGRRIGAFWTRQEEMPVRRTLGPGGT